MQEDTLPLEIIEGAAAQAIWRPRVETFVVMVASWAVVVLESKAKVALVLC